jgi:hypothetical protein
MASTAKKRCLVQKITNAAKMVVVLMVAVIRSIVSTTRLKSVKPFVEPGLKPAAVVFGADVMHRHLKKKSAETRLIMIVMAIPTKVVATVMMEKAEPARQNVVRALNTASKESIKDVRL